MSQATEADNEYLKKVRPAIDEFFRTIKETVDVPNEGVVKSALAMACVNPLFRGLVNEKIDSLERGEDSAAVALAFVAIVGLHLGAYLQQLYDNPSV